ncbi:GlcNAc-PI de-N-acetylase [Variovorax sp. PDC80]|uniref:PIG-L deacetylase family protein n=1 Tax=Variovorax sp. PDC80 TaxID=1882827 RepID=UPI0008E52722|nr:PIG-L family deacetylase [Variovorax sp. PDC80]SFP89954.1 GlcNAc-PI de-N-acetylase [Variovorax sp. PDC80]
MPTEVPVVSSSGVPVAVFLLPHQDDEFGAFHRIVRLRASGVRVVCVYFTTGVPAGGDPSPRNRESLAVLAELGVEDVLFVGEQLSIADGEVCDSLARAADWLKPWLAQAGRLEGIYVPAWEGGHPDHDGLHAVALQVCTELGLSEKVWQFALYNGERCPGPFFKVLSPLRGNGPVERDPMPPRSRLRFLRLVLRYPSQARTWIGLFPFVLMHHVLSGNQQLQQARIERLNERPHAGRLYYEKRGFSTWQAVSQRIARWRLARVA